MDPVNYCIPRIHRWTHWTKRGRIDSSTFISHLGPKYIWKEPFWNFLVVQQVKYLFFFFTEAAWVPAVAQVQFLAEEFLQCFSVHALRGTVSPLLFWPFHPIFMIISWVVFQSLNAADAIMWKIIGPIESPCSRHKWALFYLSLVLWDIPEKDENTDMHDPVDGRKPYCPHFVSMKMEGSIQHYN